MIAKRLPIGRAMVVLNGLPLYPDCKVVCECWLMVATRFKTMYCEINIRICGAKYKPEARLTKSIKYINGYS